MHDATLQQVFLNGVRQIANTDYKSVNSNSSTTHMTSGTASHIYFLAATDSADVVSMVALGTVSAISVVPAGGGSFTGAVNGTSLTLSGDLTVNGTNTIINSTTVQVDDKNIELAHSPSGSEGNDAAVDGGGIILKSSDSDKTILWENDTNQWNVNQKWTENAGSSAWHRPLTTMLGLG